MTASTQQELVFIAERPQRPLPLPTRCGWRFFWVAATLLPWTIFPLLLDSGPAGATLWQSGRFRDYVNITLGSELTPHFLPFLIYASLSLLALAWRPAAAAQRFPIRLGIYTGTLLALQFNLQLGLSTEYGFGILFVYLFSLLPHLGLWGALQLIWRRKACSRRQKFGHSLIGYAFSVVAISLLTGDPGAFGLVLLSTYLAGLGLCLPLGVWMSARLLRDWEPWARPSWQRPFLSLGWFTTYLLTWHVTLRRMFEIYATLPTEQPPQCYIATAAAQGHPQVVGRVSQGTANQRPFPINRQLQRLKGGELLLMTLTPRLHPPLRQTYDHLGPPLARRMRSPFVADAAYLLLKPVEWLTLLFLHLGRLTDLTHRFYLNERLHPYTNTLLNRSTPIPEYSQKSASYAAPWSDGGAPRSPASLPAQSRPSRPPLRWPY